MDVILIFTIISFQSEYENWLEKLHIKLKIQRSTVLLDRTTLYEYHTAN